jgi:hypothetical protein
MAECCVFITGINTAMEQCRWGLGGRQPTVLRGLERKFHHTVTYCR